MTENTAAQTIEIDDTVRLAGRKGKGVVTGLKPGFVEICYTFNVRRYGQGRGCSMSIGWYAAERVELVRKGNAVDDAASALLAEVDAARTARAAEVQARETGEAREVGTADLARWRGMQQAHEARHDGDAVAALMCAAGGTPECGFTAE